MLTLTCYLSEEEAYQHRRVVIAPTAQLINSNKKRRDKPDMKSVKSYSRERYFVFHLIVWVELAAVHIIVVTPKHRDKFSCMEGIDCHRAAAGHKHKLRAAATRHGELQLFTTLIADLSVIYLREDKEEKGTMQVKTEIQIFIYLFN